MRMKFVENRKKLWYSRNTWVAFRLVPTWAERGMVGNMIGVVRRCW